MNERLELRGIDHDITRMVVDGESNKVIAARLGIPLGTVKWRLHRLYERFGVRSRTQFVLKLRDLEQQ